MLKTKFMFWILVFSFCVFLIGCAGQETSSVEQAKLEKPKELLMWLVGSESQAKEVGKIGDEFFKDRGIKFRCEAISWGDAHTKYLTSIAGGVIPDIGTMGLTWGTEFGHLGAMIDLAEEFPEDLEVIKQDIFLGLWEAADYKGRVYGIPFDMSIEIMFYRNDIIPQPPETWEELVDLLKSLEVQEQGMIFDWGSMSWIGYSCFLWQAGGDFYNQEGTEAILDSDEAAQALEFFASLYTDLGVPKTGIPLEQGMRIGDFPLAISGNWKIDSLRLSAPEIKGRWSVALLPAGPIGAHTAFLGGRVMGIFNKSQNKKMAWEFIKFLFTPQTQVRLYKTARDSQDSYLPSNVSTWDILPMEEGIKQTLKLQGQDAKGPPSVLGWDKSTRFIEQAIQRVVLQGADVKEELNKAARNMNEQIKR